MTVDFNVEGFTFVILIICFVSTVADLIKKKTFKDMLSSYQLCITLITVVFLVAYWVQYFR